MIRPSVGVALVTYRARHHLARCLPPFLTSPVADRVLVVNSSSDDGTVEEAQAMGAEIMVVPRERFNHGATRNLARRHLATDITVMVTPDAYAEGADALARLVEPVAAGEAAVAYGRQLPRDGAGPIESFGRWFNYPPKSQRRRLADWPRYGAYTHFCSNAWAAWSNRALDEIGGFPHTLVSEETIAASKLLLRGYTIAYVAEARVRHSHPGGPVAEFRRHFDIGYARRAYEELLLARERDETRGVQYVRSLLGHLLTTTPFHLPQALLEIAAKYAGYRFGLMGRALPTGVCRLLSAQDFYWASQTSQDDVVEAPMLGQLQTAVAEPEPEPIDTTGRPEV
ncbi:MAG: glycosyltransferase family 2 protein [Geminicoccaceae bacterium]